MAKDPKDKTVLRVQCKPKLKVNCKNKKYNIQFAQKRSASMTVQMTQQSNKESREMFLQSKQYWTLKQEPVQEGQWCTITRATG